MTDVHGWTPITAIGNVPLREGRSVTVGDTEIAIFRLEDRCLTIENKCPHKGGPLCDGIVSGVTVVCPLHGQRFDLETGMPVLASQPAGVLTFPTRVENGIIFVDLAGAHKVSEEAAA
jgi:NAD(P)H-dependent nitrite reductase small subunit